MLNSVASTAGSGACAVALALSLAEPIATGLELASNVTSLSPNYESTFGSFMLRHLHYVRNRACTKPKAQWVRQSACACAERCHQKTQEVKHQEGSIRSNCKQNTPATLAHRFKKALGLAFPLLPTGFSLSPIIFCTAGKAQSFKPTS